MINNLIIWLKRVWVNIQIDFWLVTFQIHKAQYVDTNFGNDIREAERKKRAFRNRIIATSLAPIHAGFDWGKEL